jgi:hypothetical protein
MTGNLHQVLRACPLTPSSRVFIVCRDAGGTAACSPQVVSCRLPAPAQLACATHRKREHRSSAADDSADVAYTSSSGKVPCSPTLRDGTPQAGLTV